MFDEEGFIEYMYDEFPTVFKGCHLYEREWLENLVKYIIETFERKEHVICALNGILPEITEEEIEKFWK